ncbi:MAG: hypothetical protein HYT79_04280 [Elusimicrobia bacterium]|nr:hypothetical protein [Elusimicrobiota bacterium]
MNKPSNILTALKRKTPLKQRFKQARDAAFWLILAFLTIRYYHGLFTGRFKDLVLDRLSGF